MDNFLEILFFVVTIAAAYAIGSIVESDHYASIQKREKEFLSLPAVSSKRIETDHIMQAQMVHGSVVISQDYFKRFLAGLRNLVGGRIVAYESLLDRARREAILRMKKMAGEFGADVILNTRLETSSIGNDLAQVGCFEVLAYGTAVKFNKNSS